MKTKLIIISITLIIFAVLPAEAQCAMCRAVLESEESSNTAKGVNNGIVYLMLWPYLLMGGVLIAIFFMLKKVRKIENADN